MENYNTDKFERERESEVQFHVSVLTFYIMSFHIPVQIVSLICELQILH